jgi:hypothetical protein
MSNFKNPTIVAHPVTSEVVTQNPDKPDYGSIRVDQVITTMENGFLNRSKRVAFIGGKLEDLKELGYKAGQVLPGKNVIKESTTPFYDRQQPKINPKTGEVVTINGQEIYRQTVYTADAHAQDELVQHDRVTVNTPAEMVSAGLPSIIEG